MIDFTLNKSQGQREVMLAGGYGKCGLSPLLGNRPYGGRYPTRSSWNMQRRFWAGAPL